MTSKAEIAYTALVALLAATPGITTVSRRLTDSSNISLSQYPALFINQTGETITPTKGFEGLNSKQMLHCDLYLNVNTSTQEAVCSTQLNELVAAIRAAIAPTPPSPYQDLSQTVSHCWISGKIEIIEGVQNGQGLAIIPMDILTNN